MWSPTDKYLVLRNDAQGVGQGFITIIDTNSNKIIQNELKIYTYYLHWDGDKVTYTSFNYMCVDQNCNSTFSLTNLNLVTNEQTKIFEQSLNKYFLSPKPFEEYNGKIYFDYTTYDDFGDAHENYNEVEGNTFTKLKNKHDSFADKFNSKFTTYELIKYEYINNDSFKVVVNSEGVKKVGVVTQIRSDLLLKIISSVTL